MDVRDTVKTVYFQRRTPATVRLPTDRGSIVVGYNIFYKPNERRILGAGEAYLTILNRAGGRGVIARLWGSVHWDGLSNSAFGDVGFRKGFRFTYGMELTDEQVKVLQGDEAQPEKMKWEEKSVGRGSDVSRG